MTHPKSRFFQRPATKIGWWSAGLTILAMVMLTINNTGMPFVGSIPEKILTILITSWDMVMLGSLLAGIVLGIIAIIARRERSWMVWLFTLPTILLLVFFSVMLVERFSYSNKVEVAPTPDVAIERIPIIFDDDGSPDGTSALLYLLSDPRADVRAVSVSYGEAHPQVYIQYLGSLLARYGYGSIPLGAGQDLPLSGDNAFPDFVRESSNDFWGYSIEFSDNDYPVQDSAQLMSQVILDSEKPITLLITGALTNLAQALRIEPGIKNNIAAVYIMGGAVYVPGNINGLLPESKNLVAEWNIFADPLAAAEVFSSGLPLYLVPLDATNQVTLTQRDIDTWRKGGSIPDFAADIYESRMKDWGRDEIEMWDLVTVELMMNPQHCRFIPLALGIVTDEGETEGQTIVKDGNPNVFVCLNPDAGKIKSTLAIIFSSRK